MDREPFHELREMSKHLNSKCVLHFGNYGHHLHVSKLASDCCNIFSCYLSPNITAPIHSKNRGIMQNLTVRAKKIYYIESPLHGIENNGIGDRLSVENDIELT